MVILAILSFISLLIRMILRIAFSVLTINTMPSEILDYTTQFLNILKMGVNLFNFIVGPIALKLLQIALALYVLRKTWDLIWFIISKIKLSKGDS